MGTDAGVERAREWLSRHGLGHIQPSELLVARLDARRRGLRAQAVAGLALVAALALWNSIEERSGVSQSEIAGLARSGLLNLAIILAMGVGLWHQHRVERHRLPATRTRSAHPAATGVAKVLGPGHVLTVTVVYGGGLLLGATAALVASRQPDRVLALAFLVSVVVLGALACLSIAVVLRRPSVAEDSGSLLVDDVLRAQDAQTALAPFPILVALVAAFGSGTIGSWLMWIFLGYAALGAVCWVVAEIVGPRARRPSGVAS